jgi:cytochrome bd-type quinol oxidase subunit 2
VGTIWWSIGMVLAIAYFIYVYRSIRGKVTVEPSEGSGIRGQGSGIRG